jgi:cytochrome d ubiquinol oxidase subunit II
MTAALVLRGVIGAALVAYVLSGGADFGAGVWDLLARGRRAERERAAIAHAIAPIWEANHIWLILAVVLAFTGFPVAFAVVATALHIPIALALVGVVLRGAAFTFRAYGLQRSDLRARWGWVFAWSSLVTPVCLGLVVGGMSSDAIEVEGSRVVSGYLAGWTSPFAIGVGALTLASVVLLAAVYLAADLDDDVELRDAFRRRAILCEGITGACALAVALLAARDSPRLLDALIAGPWALPVHVMAFVAATTTLWALVTRRFALARVSVGVQIAAVVIGWGLANGDDLVLGAVSLRGAGVVPHVVEPVLWTLAASGLVLVPALVWLLRVFKVRRASTIAPAEDPGA